ncbi:uncharacterized protein LY79DRAFT_581924 [Colletotrichum navitas]|uniref:Uncharacterized protein n=1 Tax=Colletotrichum navitas TaxID=681940 RepID=A0AAD8PUA1_9PEZI|nr:uncharacterized protein LY79DRAFT_581924 [Colletotrichum navitas]KAK1580335.1 hypothetical protein LY79DRAFT_581924 [Colletotrichum navitas]
MWLGTVNDVAARSPDQIGPRPSQFRWMRTRYVSEAEMHSLAWDEVVRKRCGSAVAFWGTRKFRGADTEFPIQVEPVIVVPISKPFADKTVPVLIPYQEGTSQFLNGDSTAGKQAQGHEAVRVCSGTRNGGWLASLGINASRQKCGPIHFSPKDA